MKTTKIKHVRRYKAGYEVRLLWHDGTPYGSKDFATRNAFNPQGDYIGNPKMAYYLVVKRGIQPIKRTPENTICSIGYSAKDGKWYGWSHRAIFGFQKGDAFKPGDVAFDILPGFQAETTEEAMFMAMAFAEDVS